MQPFFNDIFTEMAALIMMAAVIGAIAIRLRQPLIVAFIVVGILAGPSGLAWVTVNDQLDLLAKMGIALLLFVVGLKLDIHIIRTTGPVALATGMGQVFFTSVVGFLIAIALGMAPVPALYVAVALTFSSTIIIVKLLSDKGEVETLHGRIAIGFLIVQDIFVVLVMIGLTALGQAGDITGLGHKVIEVLINGALFIIVIGLLMRYVLTPLLKQLARSQELLVLFAIAWAVTLASVGVAVGFSKEVGAFLAGVSLASTPYREAIGSRLVSLRDFLLLFFFIDLGAQLDLGMLGEQIAPAILFSLFVLIGNPLIVMLIMRVLGYQSRTGFLAGLTVAQISEFSLILGALGLALGHINRDTMSLITLVGLITISISTYMILYSHPLYERLKQWLVFFERNTAQREAMQEIDAKNEAEYIIFGLGRLGSLIAQKLCQKGHRVIGVDFNPDLIRNYEAGFEIRYGNAEDTEFLNSLPLNKVRWIVSSIRDRNINHTLLHGLQQWGYIGHTALSSHSERDANSLKQAGADFIINPYAEVAQKVVDSLLE